ncbi:2-amino-4-hydroxy-6-hydroxymethyldihydropteridine diphosphokinase [Novosphingobium sp. Leaf2]|uniref:2-amino-4-hydroxy-6- hydroxymethyldihydropteridine diphosphokinase n=1 Tax=Novosphingobium sp. Leaf2 TaxID=1735670 RepID=UPI0006F8E2A9|nr:2-amino-4-hydroxy-6-hydroxymethyldihydropteridine diphosphokinase [Novosphingobium sp. Leaf2]KQM19259.1 2-amino-4-hydroxy-6-hydroxymethyldihydropteridine pyrophosphokinase [Novosphingobium sp. Leaf2]
MAKHRYLIALGSNQRHASHGSPRAVVAAAIKALDRGTFTLMTASRVIDSAPLGPSLRRYANAAALVRTRHEPPAVLRKLHKIERRFGRRRRGQQWGARVLDLDIVMWSGGLHEGTSRGQSLTIPHPEFRDRPFVTGPARQIAGLWRDPLTNLTIRQLHARLTKPRAASR